MSNGKNVRPAKWQNVLDLYDNGEYSAIWGNYDGSNNKTLGVRWNGGEGELGYPNMAGNPVWYVEPDFLHAPLLHKIFSDVKNNNNLGSIDNILTALQDVLNYNQNQNSDRRS
ncbi:hypothetical protein FACS189440_13060 [Bacteroidia bacterium]|jgi:hypothetical protein|nr:hypothetical protein FACS189440_13060 [Bacteroidia bacterium]